MMSKARASFKEEERAAEKAKCCTIRRSGSNSVFIFKIIAAGVTFLPYFSMIVCKDVSTEHARCF